MSNAVNVEPLTLRPSPAMLALADPPQTAFGEGEGFNPLKYLKSQIPEEPDA